MASAKTCCSEPLKCQPSQNTKLFTGNFTTTGATGSISQNCAELQKKLSQAGRVSQQMAQQCQQQAETCSKSCSQAIMHYIQKPFFETCAFDLNQPEKYDPARHNCAEDMIDKYRDQYQKDLVPLLAQCAEEGKKAQNLSQAGEKLLKSALSAQQCQQQVSAGLGKPSANSPNSDPASKNKDITARASNKPQLNLPTAQSGFSGSTPSSSDSSSSSSLQENGHPVAGQKPVGGGFNHKAGSVSAGKLSALLTKRKLSAIKTGSVTMNQGGRGLSGSNTFGTNTNSGAKDPKKDLNGNKLVQKSGPANSAQNTTSTQDSDLAKAKNNPYLKHTPRNVSSAVLDPFGSPHDNIFERITNRMTLMCRQKVLDCD